MKKLFFVLFVITVAASACAPSSQIVATAIAQTQVAVPTDTPLPPTVTPTFTPIPPTNTPTETPTQTLTPTSTPDVRIITADPKDILCTKTDLPSEGLYFLPANSTGHDTNELITRGSTSAADMMKQYVKRTERIDGWWIRFTKGNDSLYRKIKYIYCSAENFQTTEGAQLAVREFNDAELNAQYGAKYINDPSQPSIGDVSFLIGNDTYKEYSMVFSYRNYRMIISSINQGQNFYDLYDVAQKILKKLDDAPLSAP